MLLRRTNIYLIACMQLYTSLYSVGIYVLIYQVDVCSGYMEPDIDEEELGRTFM